MMPNDRFIKLKFFSLIILSFHRSVVVWSISTWSTTPSRYRIVSSSLRMSDIDEDYYANLLVAKTELEQETEPVIPSKAIKHYREKQRVKREWSHELERWRQLGIKARRSRRNQTRSEQMKVQAKRLAIKFVLAQEDTAVVIPKLQMERATAFFDRLLQKLFDMETDAYQRGKERAIQRELEIVRGNATSIEEYLQELELIRAMEQDKRRKLKEHVFELPQDWRSLDDETLMTTLRIRGNVKNLAKIYKRVTIERCLQESFSKPLF